MTSDWARFGVEPGWSFAIPHRVRWSECDPFGHANHRAYFEWFEEARNRYLEAVGLAPLSPDTPGPVIAETGIRYHRPLVYADEILVTARTVRLGRTSFEMEYAVWRDGLCALGRAVLILVVNATGEKTPLPPELRERILARDPDAQARRSAMKRAVIVICDSLRADLITPRDAPFLSEFGQRSARFANHTSVFPSTTRTSAASIATGCLPARHGLLGNTMAIDEGDGLVCLSVGKPDFRDRLHRATGRTLHRADPRRAGQPRRRDRDRDLERVAGRGLFPRPRRLWLGLQPGRQLRPRPPPAARRGGARDLEGRRRRRRRDRAVLRGSAARARPGDRAAVALGAGLYGPPHPARLAGASPRDRERRRECAPRRRDRGGARSDRRATSSSSSAPITAWRRSTRRSISTGC